MQAIFIINFNLKNFLVWCKKWQLPQLPRKRQLQQKAKDKWLEFPKYYELQILHILQLKEFEKPNKLNSPSTFLALNPEFFEGMIRPKFYRWNCTA